MAQEALNQNHMWLLKRHPDCKGDEGGVLGTGSVPGFMGHFSLLVGNILRQANTHAPRETLSTLYEAQAGSKMSFCSRVVCSKLQCVNKANIKGE